MGQAISAIGKFLEEGNVSEQGTGGTAPDPDQYPADPVYYNNYQKKQKDADTYDSTLGISRFQGTAPRHF